LGFLCGRIPLANEYLRKGGTREQWEKGKPLRAKETSAERLRNNGNEQDHPIFAEGSSEIRLLGESEGARGLAKPIGKPDWRSVVAVLLIIGGLGLLASGWWGITGTRDTATQLAYILSGGIAGAILMGLGSLALIMREHVEDRAALNLLRRELKATEERLTATITDGRR
jgi:hypothetical protein